MKKETHETMSVLSDAVNKMNKAERNYIVAYAEGMVARKEIKDAEANSK